MIIQVDRTQTAVGLTEQYSAGPLSQFTSSRRFKVLQYHLFYKIMRFRIQNTKVLPFAALYGYKKWFLTLREEHKLQAFENKTGNLCQT